MKVFRSFLLGVGLLMVASPAFAQMSKRELQELDRLSQDRSSHEGPVLRGRPPPASHVRPEALHQPSGLWRCMGTAQYQPIYARPSATSHVIGRSDGRIAAGADDHRFTSVLFHEGVVGYVPTSAVEEFHNQFQPSLGCRFAGLRTDGTVVFASR